MKATIDISDIIQDLEATYTAVYPNEFSGFGFVEPSDLNGMTSFKVYDWFLMDVGSYVLTTIPVEDQLHIRTHPDRKFMRVWIHAHPVGNGIPGSHCWSGTDENAIATSPMGTIPELMPWMLAVVRTPLGWVGRFDVPGVQTDHLPVYPSMRGAIEQGRYLKSAYESTLQPEFQIGYGSSAAEYLNWYDDYEDEENDELYDEIFGTVQSEPKEDPNYRSWWHRFIGGDYDGKDGGAGQDF